MLCSRGISGRAPMGNVGNYPDGDSFEPGVERGLWVALGGGLFWSDARGDSEGMAMAGDQVFVVAGAGDVVDLVGDCRFFADGEFCFSGGE